MALSRPREPPAELLPEGGASASSLQRQESVTHRVRLSCLQYLCRLPIDSFHASFRDAGIVVPLLGHGMYVLLAHTAGLCTQCSSLLQHS